MGHVTAYQEDLYTVYFVEDGRTKKKLLPSQLHESNSYYPTRGAMIHKEWFFEGDDEVPAGMWKVRKLDTSENTYRCTRLTGEGKNVDDFDVGYVITQYWQQETRRREQGFGTVLSSRTRTRRAPADSR